MQKLTPQEFCSCYAACTAPKTLLDVRTPQELQNDGAIPGAVNIPVQVLAEQLGSLNTDHEIFIFCKAGGRAEVAYQILSGAGFRTTAIAVNGGYVQIAPQLQEA